MTPYEYWDDGVALDIKTRTKPQQKLGKDPFFFFLVCRDLLSTLEGC